MKLCLNNSIILGSEALFSPSCFLPDSPFQLLSLRSEFKKSYIVFSSYSPHSPSIRILFSPLLLSFSLSLPPPPLSRSEIDILLYDRAGTCSNISFVLWPLQASS